MLAATLACTAGCKKEDDEIIYIFPPPESRVPDDYATIQEAIFAAQPGEIITVANGTYTGAGNKNIVFDGKAVTVKSESGPANCTIDLEGSGRAFICDTKETGFTVIEGFTITGGRSGYGGSYCRDSSPRFIDCTFHSNACWAREGFGRGGAMYVYRASPTFSNCVFADNVAEATGRGGAVYCEGAGAIFSHPVFDHCTFYGNEADAGEGGCVYLSPFCSASFSNSILSFSGGGEAVFCDSSATASLVCCDVYGNAGGDWVGCLAGQDGTDDNFSADPLFCEPDSLDLALAENSPCTADNAPLGCGLIGACDVGCAMTGVRDDRTTNFLARFYLGEAVPNPFNPITEITYGIPASNGASRVLIMVYDVLGRNVRTLVDADQAPGAYRVTWDGCDDCGVAVASGVYFYRITWMEKSETKRMVLLK